MAPQAWERLLELVIPNFKLKLMGSKASWSKDRLESVPEHL